jgi:uncharacterized damage-inducible protein DinB
MEQPIEHSLTNEFRNKAEKVLDTRDKLIARIEALPEQKQQTANPHGGFSPLELLSHFALVEQQYIDLWHKTDRAKYSGARSKPNFLYKMVLNRMRTAKVSTALKDHTPRTQPLLEQGKEHWTRTSNELLGFLATLRNPHFIAVKHPWFGTLSAMDILDLLDAHQHYHEVRFPW